MKIAVIDYGAGNLFSVKNALDYLGMESVVTRDPACMEQADGLILPGVGAFPDAMDKLTRAGLVDPIRDLAQKKPFLGICLGMQLLFDEGFEFEPCKGLGLIPGKVIRIEAPGLAIPHMGYNDLTISNPCALTARLTTGDYVYFVHSYRAETAPEYISAYTLYGDKIPALVCRGNIYGAQFHPEKSGDTGLKILSDFGGLCK